MPPAGKSIYLSILIALSSTGSPCASSISFRLLEKSIISLPEKLLLLLFTSLTREGTIDDLLAKRTTRALKTCITLLLDSRLSFEMRISNLF